MIERIRPWFRGIAVAAASMAVFAIAVGCFLALMLLVISMEEGGDNLSASAMSLTSAVVLLSQGVGFTVDPVNLTLMPLLLTVSLVLLVRAFAQRLTCGAGGYVTGLAAWLALDALFSKGTDAILDDALWLILVKGAAVFSLGYLMAALPVSVGLAATMERLRRSAGPQLLRAVRIGITIAVALIASYVTIGFISVIVWSVRNHAAVMHLYDLLGMGTGSRILTTIACLAWLPNLCVWAISWTFGGGFSIGDLGSFTLWIGQSTSLPSIPVFGVLPEPVADERLRIALISIPLVLGLLAGTLSIWSKRGFSIRAAGPANPVDPKIVMLDFAYPAGSFCIACALISLGCSLMFLLSDGGLGKERLAHLGVDVMQSTQTVARPAAFGLFAAWLLALIGVASVFGIRWIARRIRANRASAAVPSDDGTTNAEKRPVKTDDRRPVDATGTSRTARIITNVPDHGQQQEAATKEEQDDKHEPTDTTGAGVRLP